MDKKSKIFVAGHRGLCGSAILRRLSSEGYLNLATRSRADLDLINREAVDEFFQKEKPEYVFLAAAKVGGILANSEHPADFIRDNLFVQTNVIDAAWRFGCKRLLFLGSSCIYPKFAEQPLKETALLTGPLEPTNEAYAIAKIAGIKMCQAYRQQYGFDVVSLMPTNLYGPGDNFDLESSHVLPALIRKFHEANLFGLPEVELWGSGNPKREFLHVDDLARAAVYVMQTSGEKLDRVAPDRILNVGTGKDIEIRELAELIQLEANNKSEIVFDRTKPDGTPRKLLDVSRIESLGWRPEISLREGIRQTYSWYLEREESTASASA
ncbi:MAG: GDP-fucose synthetase [Acidobacteria bacterium]|nr:MAG: GDP-fucose synthetase [Acidobacteriota bacterium]